MIEVLRMAHYNNPIIRIIRKKIQNKLKKEGKKVVIRIKQKAGKDIVIYQKGESTIIKEAKK